MNKILNYLEDDNWYKIFDVENEEDIEYKLLEREEVQTLLKEIERLTELCNKYEEEHKTTFETWQKDIKENEQLHSIIKEVREYIEENMKIVSKEQAEDTKLPIGTFMWNVDKILQILDKVEDKK